MVPLPVYEDDGVSMDYEKGCYLKTFVSMTAGERTVLTFKQEGSYATSVETMALDMIHRKSPILGDCRWKKKSSFPSQKKI